MSVTGPFIVVAPLATLPNWIREFEKWLPSQPVIRFHGPAKDRDAMLAGPLHYKNKRNDDFPIIVTSYEIAIREKNRLQKLSDFTFVSSLLQGYTVMLRCIALRCTVHY